jgi:hypothetical protein
MPMLDFRQGKDISLVHSGHAGSSAQPAYQCVPVKISPWIKRLGRDADHPSPTSAEIKKSGSMPPLHYMSPWRCACYAQGELHLFYLYIYH